MVETRIRRSILCIAVFLAGTLSFERQVHASFLLSDLISHTNGSNGTLLQGDKLFSNFSYSQTGDMPLASAIAITGTTISGNHGINISGVFRDLASSPSSSSAVLNYVVSVTVPGLAIYGARMQGNPVAPAINGGDFGLISVAETFTQNGSNNIIQAITGTGTISSSNTSFGPTVSLNVSSSIFGNQIAGVPLPTITTIDQTFVQGVAPVPEPGSAVIMITGAGLFCLNWIRRRRLPANV